MNSKILRDLVRDKQGAALIEFAILAPAIFAMMFGVLQVGYQMFTYNAVRAVASDTARYTIIEYQKQNLLTAAQIEDKAEAYAVNAPYDLDATLLTATATKPVSDITGTTKFLLTLTYVPANFLGFMNIGSPTITVTRPVYVAT